MAYKEVRLGDYFKFEKGLGYKGDFLAEESDVALIGMDSHEEGGGGYKEGSEKPYVGPYKPEHVAEVGDVIFAATEQGFGLLASPLMVPESDKFQTYIYSHHLLKAFPIKEGFLPEYLYNIFRIDRFRSRAAYGDTGTTVRALPAEVLEEQFIPRPDLPTQLAINGIISLFDQQISNNKLLAQNLISLCHSNYISILNRSTRVNTVKLTEVADIKFGAPFSSNLFNTKGEGRPLIRIRDLQPQEIELWTTESLAKGFMAKSGDLLIGMDGDFSPYLWFGEEALVNQRITSICPKGNLGILYLYFELLTIMKLVQHGSSGSTVAHLSKGEIESIEITQLTKEESVEFHQIIDPCFDMVKQIKKNNIHLIKLLKSLLPTLITETILNPLELASL